MKCKECFQCFTPADAVRRRCPYCGAVNAGKKEKIPVVIWVVSVWFLLFGLLFFAVGLNSLLEYEEAKPYHTQVDAQIVKILVEKTVDSDGDVDTDHTVFVSYEYEGTLYQNVELGHYNSSMEEGDWVQVKIDSRNPGETIENLWWIMIIGLVPMAIGGGVLYSSIKKRRKQGHTAEICC